VVSAGYTRRGLVLKFSPCLARFGEIVDRVSSLALRLCRSDVHVAVSEFTHGSFGAEKSSRVL
jgi:hypothetical protein